MAKIIDLELNLAVGEIHRVSPSSIPSTFTDAYTK